MNKIFLGLLLFTPLALGAAYLQLSPILIFVLAAIAIVPLAKFIGEATEELSGHTGPAIGGLMNATFGNATELIIGIFALHAGLIEVVKASITGSILGNLLLVLGMAIVAGGWKREKQQFNQTAAKASVSMLILATIALVIPAIFAATSPVTAIHPVMNLSVLVSIMMILAYGAYLFFSLKTHKHLYETEESVIEPQFTVKQSLLVLGAATIAVAFVSEVLVGAIEPLVSQFGWTQLFIGVVVVAIVGNAAEHVSAITVAIRNRMDLSLQIAIGSATQIVMFVAPVLVLVSLFFAQPMDLVFNLFELVAVIFSIFVTNAVIEDGESNWLEGVQLLVAYAIMAVAFFLHT